MRACTFLSKGKPDMMQRPRYLNKLIDKKENGILYVGIEQFLLDESAMDM